jgi:hypothetical protein
LRWGRTASIVLGALACAVALAPPAAATDTENDIEDALAVFTVKGTHGYSMLVFAAPEVDEAVGPGGKRKGTALVALIRKQSSAVYFAPATMTADFVEGRPTITSLQVSLGKQGRLALDFKPSGGRTAARARCRRAPLVYAAGSYEGAIEFHGEQDFTEVSATSVPQRPEAFLNLICRSRSVSEVSGPRLPGAKLSVEKLELGGASVGLVKLQVNKNRPGAKVHVEAGTLEERGPIEIFRNVEMEAPPNAFAFDRRLRHGRVSLGAPFAGRAVFRRDAKHTKRWTGNLTVDFPGRSDVRLTGRGFDVTLEHAVRRVTR